MSTRFSSLAAVLAFSSFVLVGCAGETGEPDVAEGASTSESASDVPAEGTLQAQGFTYRIYYYCGWVFQPGQGFVIGVASTLDRTQALDVANSRYSLERTSPNGTCYSMRSDTI